MAHAVKQEIFVCRNFFTKISQDFGAVNQYVSGKNRAVVHTVAATVSQQSRISRLPTCPLCCVLKVWSPLSRQSRPTGPDSRQTSVSCDNSSRKNCKISVFANCLCLKIPKLSYHKTFLFSIIAKSDPTLMINPVLR